MKNIIFIAPPAAGKGTQSKMVSMEYNIPHISTGDLLRDEVEAESKLGQSLTEDMRKGNLVSDDIIINLLRSRISKVDCNNGYILDGFPRDIEQAYAYRDLLKELGKDIGIVIYLDVSSELALKRTLGRIVCSSCGMSYNRDVEELKPKIDGICDKCGHALKVRNDDNQDTYLNRYETYVKETGPLIDYYQNLGILRVIKVQENDSAQEIFNKVKAFID